MDLACTVAEVSGASNSTFAPVSRFWPLSATVTMT